MITPVAHGQQAVSAQESLVPNPETMFGVAPAEYIKSLEQIDPDVKTKLESQLNLSIQTVFETFFLNSGLYLTYREQERRHGREQLERRLIEKSDDLSVKYDVEGIGKAELILIGRGKKQMPLTMIRLNSGRYILFIDTSQYDPDMFKENIPEGYSQKDIELELKLRSITKGLVHGLVSRLLIFAKNGGSHIPLYKIYNPETSQEEIQSEMLKEIDPLAKRYAEIEEEMSRIETSDYNYEKLLAEKEVIEEAVIRLEKNKSSFWGKMVQTGSISMSGSNAIEGMPVTVIYHNQGQFSGSKNIDRPHEDTLKASLNKWATYGKALHESIHFDWETWYKSDGLAKLNAVRKGDPYYAAFNTRWQVALSMTSGYLLTFMTDNAPNWGAMGMTSLIWGVAIGLNIRTFLNWTLSGTELSKSLKDTFLGLAFGVSAYLVDPSKSLGDVALITWATMIGSQLLKNAIKKGPREFQSYKKRAGLTNGEYATPIERHYLDIRNKQGQVTSTIELKIPFKLVRKILEHSLNLRTEKVGEIPREVKKEAVLSTEMTLKTFIPKTLATFSWIAFPFYAAMGPYWEKRSVEDKEVMAKNYAREHGENTPKARQYLQEAIDARTQWEDYRIVDAESLLPYGIDLRNSKVFEKGVIIPSQYVGYYAEVIKSISEDVKKFFSEKSIDNRIHEYASNAYYKYKVRQKQKEMRFKNTINMAYPLKRKAPALGSCRAYFL